MTKTFGFVSVRSVIGFGTLIMLLPLLGAAALVQVSSAYLQRRAVENSLEVRARALASVTASKVQDLFTDLHVMRAAPGVNTDRPALFYATAEHYAASHPEWLTVALLNSSGAVLSCVGSDRRLPAGVVADIARLGGATRGIHIAGLIVGARLLVGAFEPVRQGDRITGWLVAVIPAANFLPALSDYDRAEGNTVALLGRQRLVLAATDSSLVGQSWPYTPIGLSPALNRPLTSHARLAGQRAYSVIAHLPTTPWEVALVVPAEMLEEPLHLSRLLLAGLAGLLVLACVPSLLLGEWLGRRIHALAAIADAVAHDTALPALSPTPLKELGAVQAALVQAAHLVRERSTTQQRLRLLESSLNRLQQLESVGQVAAAIAHDFGSHLFVIRGRLQLIQGATRDRPEIQELLEPTVQVAEKAVELVQELTSLAAQKPDSLPRINVNMVLREMAPILRHLAGPGVYVELRPAKNLWDCRFDPKRLQSVLVNLVTNARDALPNGGSIRIATHNLTIGEDSGPIRAGVSPGRYVSLIVADDGIGMSQETIAQIFEPFFSTKPKGHGTGIGLSVLSGSIRAAGGNILVESTLGVGSTFTILLPEMGAVPPETASSAA